MDRRLFLLSGLAGFADPVTPLLKKTEAGPPAVASGDAAFDAWAQDFLERAVSAGWPEGLLRAQLAGLTPDPAVLQADHAQPEFTRPIGDYMRSAVSDSRVATAKDKLAGLGDWPARIQARFGADPAVLMGVWGMESDFGVAQGDFDVVRSLATLAADGRRRAWAEGQLLAALRIVATDAAPRPQLRGSWAGAMGQTQFEPTVYLSRAVDMDGDGRADIWGSAPDALGSAANLLAQAGWKPGEGWAREVLLPPGFDFTKAEGPLQPPPSWAAAGVRRADGQDWSPAEAAEPCMLLIPAGAAGPAFLALPNHFVIRKYNNAVSYALAVGLIADGVAGAPPLTAAWPVELPLSRDDRMGAQQALKALGFDVGTVDGVVGTQTRAALRAWQSKQGLIPDGHLTVDLAQRLHQEAASR